MTASAESSESFRIPIEAAELYESAFVPGFFAQWAPMLCDAAGLSVGQRVLDVACGTGIVTRTAADRVGSGGSVVGVDLNEAMLTVAARVRPDLEWHQGDAAALPFPDDSFDVVLSQMALMFFRDRGAAMREMARVARLGGTVAVLVPSSLDEQPAFKPFVELAARLTGAEAMSLLTTYFVCGDRSELGTLMQSVGMDVTTSRSVAGIYGAESVDAAVRTEVESTPLIERISESTYRQLREEAHAVFSEFTQADGSLAAPFRCNVVVATRR